MIKTTYEGTLVEYLETDYDPAVVLVSDEELVKVPLSEVRSISIT